jgi:hypothetical protein
VLQHSEHGKPMAFGKINWAEKRNSVRRPTQEAARIVIKGSRVLDCRLVNLSETGACIRVASVVGIPEEFDLEMNEEPTLRKCQFKWALDGCVGVRFI